MKTRECTLLASIITFIIFLGGYVYGWIEPGEMIMVTVICTIIALVSVRRMNKKGW